MKHITVVLYAMLALVLSGCARENEIDKATAMPNISTYKNLEFPSTVIIKSPKKIRSVKDAAKLLLVYITAGKAVSDKSMDIFNAIKKSYPLPITLDK